MGQIQEPEKKHGEAVETVPTRRKFKIRDQVLVKVETRTKDKERYGDPYRIIKKYMIEYIWCRMTKASG